MRNKEKKARFSLKWRILQMILLSWVLPTVGLVILTGAYMYNQILATATERYELYAQSAFELTVSRLESATSASRAASYNPIIRQAWQGYQRDGDEVALYEQCRSYFYQQYQYEELFDESVLVFLSNPSAPIYVTNSSKKGSSELIAHSKEVIEEAIAHGSGIDTQICYFQKDDAIFMIRNLVDKEYNPFAVLVMQLNQELMFHEFSKIVNAQSAMVQINGTVTQIHPQVQEQLKPLIGEENFSVEYHNGKMQTVIEYIHDDYHFSYQAINRPSILQQQWGATLLVLSGVVLLMIPLGFLIFRFFVVYVTAPIEVIIEGADKIRAQKYGTHVSDERLQSEEMGTLGDNFNAMSDTLQQQFEHIYKEEIALRDAKMMALQSQINPHFLNNTLEIINWEARMQGDLKVCNMIESLSVMLTAAMDRKNRPLVHLSEELMYVNSYLYIINERLGKRLQFEKNIPEELLDCTVPRLILQPILENAVEHGITPVQRGRICLTAWREEDWLVLAVENDGSLTEQDRVRIETVLQDDYTPDNLSSGSLGLRNVNQRLRILYGKESGVLVDITKTNATIFKIKVKIT